MSLVVLVVSQSKMEVEIWDQSDHSRHNCVAYFARSNKFQICNHSKGIACSIALMKIPTGNKGVKFKALMLTCHHSEGDAHLVSLLKICTQRSAEG